MAKIIIITSSNHRLESAGLNAREQLLFIGNREDGNAWQKIGVTFDSHQVKLANYSGFPKETPELKISASFFFFFFFVQPQFAIF